jgi:molybdenum cofactor guanylyltransferase
MRYGGFIQAGGKSSRMGCDKSWVEVEGRPMIEHVLSAAAQMAEALAVVIHADAPARDRYEDLARRWDARLLTDLHDHRGPLGGIHTALVHSPPDCTALVLACDLPFLNRAFLSLLARIHETESNAFTAPADPDGRLQPLAALYGPACLPAVEGLLAANRLRADGIRDRVKSRIVPFAEFAHLPDAHRLLLNLNSPADLVLPLLMGPFDGPF